jgi:rSAM/selenodomain-associated transferase 1
LTATRIVIFAKAPVTGKVKTRLIPALGAEGAAGLAAEMLTRTVTEARAAGVNHVELCVDPDPAHADWDRHIPHDLPLSAQGPGDLGERLSRAARRVIASGEKVILIGTDCPDLDRRRLSAAACGLQTHDAVIHPARDGGYVLLGLGRFDASLFQGIVWSTSSVAAETIARIRAIPWSLDVREMLRDVDVPADLP